MPTSLARIWPGVSFWSFCSGCAVALNATRTKSAAILIFIAYYIGISRWVAVSVGPHAIQRGGVQDSALRACRLIERRAQSLRELHRVVVRPEVQEEQPRLLVQHVAVDRRHLDSVRAQRLDHRIDFFCDQHEIAGDGSLAAAGGLKADRRGHAHGPGGGHLHPVLAARIAAWYAKLITPAVRLPFGADDLIQLGRIEIDRRLRGWGRRGCQRGLARGEA